LRFVDITEHYLAARLLCAVCQTVGRTALNMWQ